MTRIQLLDGTRNVQYGRALIPSFSEIAKYREVFVSPKPGFVDILGYRKVQVATSKSVNAQRGQTNLRILLNTLLRDNNHLIGQYSITLVQSDLYSPGINWCFGITVPDNYGGCHIVVSTFRIKQRSLLSHIVTHELGHAFGVASRGRNNTEENLGSHCTNSRCIMQQKLSLPEMEAHAKRLSLEKDKFCPECQEELRK